MEVVTRNAPTLDVRSLEDPFETLRIEPEFLGHLDKFLRGLGISDGTCQTFGSDGLVAVVVGLGHVSTFSDEYERRQKGSITTVGTAGRTPN